MTDLLRLYTEAECNPRTGYPRAWEKSQGDRPRIPDFVREEAGNRCQRCGHPYSKGDGEWSTCDEHCDHGGPIRVTGMNHLTFEPDIADNPIAWLGGDKIVEVEARWRVLTVHHLDGVKTNCLWWNLVPLCQRDHLIVQRRVVMERPWPWPHSDWFKPYAAAYYAWRYLGVNLTRAETLDRMPDLLDMGLERAREEAPWQDRLDVEA